MCLIVHKPAGVNIETPLLLDILNYNPDGWGICTWTQNGKVFATRGGSDKFTKLQKTLAVMTRRNAIFHFRKATAGDKSFSNIHPFKLGSSGIYMMHNGTFKVSAKGKMSDSAIFASMITPALEANPDLILDVGFRRLIRSFIGESFVVFCHPNGEMITISSRNWEKHRGLYFSNTYAWSRWYDN